MIISAFLYVPNYQNEYITYAGQGPHGGREGVLRCAIGSVLAPEITIKLQAAPRRCKELDMKERVFSIQSTCSEPKCIWPQRIQRGGHARAFPRPPAGFEQPFPEPRKYRRLAEGTAKCSSPGLLPPSLEASHSPAPLSLPGAQTPAGGPEVSTRVPFLCLHSLASPLPFPQGTHTPLSRWELRAPPRVPGPHTAAALGTSGLR